MADQSFTIRSISLPSSSRPATAEIEEELQRIRICADSSTAESICDGLRGLVNIYDIIDELLRLPGNQQSLSHPNQRKWVEKELNCSLRLLDLIGAVREASVAATAHIQDLQNSIRRRDCAKINESFHRDSSPLRSINKTIANSLRLLQREMGGDRKRASCFIVDGVLEEAREISIFLLRSASSLLGEARRKPKAGRWGFVTRPMHRKKVACGAFKAENEVESMAALLSGIQEMEAALGSIFGRLIRNRVSLLNVLSL